MKDDGTGRGFLHDITDEVAAFRRQYAFDPSKLAAANNIVQITSSFVKGLNPQYGTLPNSSLHTTTSQYIIFLSRHMVNPMATYYPSETGAIKNYKDSKTLFSSFIWR